MNANWILVCAVALFLVSCGQNSSGDESSLSPSQRQMKALKGEESSGDGKGIGEFKDVKLNNPLQEPMILRGQEIYDLKCAACHKLTDSRLVGPGWKGVTERRKPEWIMNMVTNVDIMLEKDPVAQAQLKECLVKMPNQNLSADDARDVLEFMYANDKGQVGK